MALTHNVVLEAIVARNGRTIPAVTTLDLLDEDDWHPYDRDEICKRLDRPSQVRLMARYGSRWPA